MSRRTLPPDPRVPCLDTLGSDLLITTARQRRLALARPFALILVFGLAVAAGLWWVTPWIMCLIFVAIVTVTHDVVHQTLGLTARQTEWALFALGAVLLESGHAYRATHRRHHRVFPGPDDPEGDPARMSFWGAVLAGPTFLPRLWLWALRRSPRSSSERSWLVAEALWPALVVATGLLAWPWTHGVILYAVQAWVGAWVFPLLTVHLPHRNYGDTPLTQTHTLRGRLIPALFLELTYHLEHHLYPEVPSHNLKALSQRLDPYLERAGVVPRAVI